MSSKKSPPAAPPSPIAIFVTYGILGAALSFSFGHDPGYVPDNLVAELCPSIIVISLFLVTYSLYDVMECGVTRAAHQDLTKKYDDTVRTTTPEAVHLAERVQANQVEQMPLFLVATITFSVLVNGKVGAVLAVLWSILRRLYASRYRNSVGIPPQEKGLATYTLPCYFILNAMLMSSAIHALRWVLL
jgi:uncharacterized MAPEG superfamily protein